MNYHVQHPEAMAGYNVTRLVVARDYEEAKAKIIAEDNKQETDYNLKHTFFDKFNNEQPKLISTLHYTEHLKECYIIDKIDGLEIKVAD